MRQETGLGQVRYKGGLILGMKIIIRIDGWKPEDRKQIVNSIRGFVKTLGKRFGFRMDFRETD